MREQQRRQLPEEEPRRAQGQGQERGCAAGVGAGVAGAGAAAWVVGAGSAAGAAGAGPLLHPPSISNPLNVSESMPAYAVVRPPVEWMALDKVCSFMILSLDAKVFAPSCQARLFQLFLNQRVSRSYCAVRCSRGFAILVQPRVDLKIDSNRRVRQFDPASLASPANHEWMITNRRSGRVENALSLHQLL